MNLRADNLAPIGVFCPLKVPQGPWRLLILKFDHIGDFFVATDALAKIRRAFPAANITFACLPSVAPLAERTGLFDRVVAFPAALPSEAMTQGITPPPDAARGAALRALLPEHYFLAADFRHDMDSRGWLDYIDADLRAGYMGLTQKGLDIVLAPAEWRAPIERIEAKNLPLAADTRLNLLAQALIDSLSEPRLNPALFPPSPVLATNDAWQKLQADRRRKIGIGMGAGAEIRLWPIAYWQKLISHLNGEGYIPVFFGSPSDAALARQAASALAEAEFYNFCGQIDLADCPTVFSCLSGYIGVDTGLTHLAARLGLPVLDIFAGVSNVSVWRARGERAAALYAKVPCAPCAHRFIKDCPYGQLCLTSLTPDDVWHYFKAQLFPR